MYLKSIQKKLLLAVLSLPVAIAAMAQDAAKTAANTQTSGYNQLAILLVIMTVILAFVIWGMGRVLVELSRQVLEKGKQSQKILGLILLLGFSLLAQIGHAQDAAKTVTAEIAPNYGGLSETAFYLFSTVIGMEVIAILFLAFSIRRMYSELLPEKVKVPEKRSALRTWWSGLDKKLFTKAVPVEKEADVMLDHNYDGIRELDNALPPWWKYGFYITIGVAFIYLLNYHVLGYGMNPDEEYVAEMAKAQIDKEVYESKNKDKVDEKNIMMADASGIQVGQGLFEANCTACHMKGGGSQNPVSVGPNLTDDYWLHKGSLNDIYNTIKNGYPDKGMQSWSSKFSPKEISQIASFVKSLRGSNPPNAKLPQGELYVETPGVPAADSAKQVKTDSASVPKK